MGKRLAKKKENEVFLLSEVICSMVIRVSLLLIFPHVLICLVVMIVIKALLQFLVKCFFSAKQVYVFFFFFSLYTWMEVERR